MSGRKAKEKIRLAELILTNGFSDDMFGAESKAASRAIAQMHRNAIRAGTKVVADNVTDYWYTIPDGKMETLRELPKIAPPWRKFWVESRLPPTASQPENRLPLWGMSVISQDFGEEGADEHFWSRMVKFWAEQHGMEPIENLTLTKPLRWLVNALIWVPRFDLLCGAPMASLWFPLDVDGLACLTTEDETALVMNALSLPRGVSLGDNPDLADQFKDEMLHLLQPLLLAVGFMHFKNIVLYDLWRSPKERKVVRRATGEGPVHFRTVVIEPEMGVDERGRPTEGEVPSRAMHMVRGHFVTYTQERPLGRGKAVGTFWRRAHFRGDRAKGLIVKDYDVRGPKQARRLED